MSRVWLFVTPRTAAHQASLSFTIFRSLLKLMSIELVMPSNSLILCCPFRLLPSIFPSFGVFSNESALLIRWPKYWSFSISPSNEYSGLISFRVGYFDLLAVQKTLKSLPQHHNSKASGENYQNDIPRRTRWPFAGQVRCCSNVTLKGQQTSICLISELDNFSLSF